MAIMHVVGPPQVGDWAWHTELTLDPRKVARVSDDGQEIWLDLGIGSGGPFPASLYRYEREEG